MNKSPIVFDRSVDVFEIPRRSFDPAKGDRRFVDQDRAVIHAEEEASRTGVRQVVRIDSEIPGGRGRFWLVQAVGS